MIFKLNNNKISFNPELLLIKEFKDIVDKYGIKENEDGYKILSFIALTEDPDSPFCNYERTMAHKAAIEQSFNNDKKLIKLIDSAIIVNAIDVFKKLVLTPEENALKTFYNTLHNVNEILDDIAITEENMPKIMSITKQIPELLEAGNKYKQNAEKAKLGIGKSRGSREASFIEKQSKKLKKDKE